MLNKGDTVYWDWGDGKAKGEVVEVSEASITKIINKNVVTRHGEPGNPAVVIKQDDGQTVLKLKSELH